MSIQFPATIELNINNLPEKFALDFNICHNPDCDCNGVNIILYDESKEIHLFLDFATESYRENNYSEEEIKILHKLIEFLKSEENHSLNLKFFKDNYNYVKDKVRKRKEALDSFELGTFLLYRDILWQEDDSELNIDKTNYSIFDSYCVSPNCDCTDVALNFFEDVHKLGIREPNFSFVYNYLNGDYKDREGISGDKVKNIISILQESYSNKFKKRHVKLKKAVKKDINKMIKERGLVLKSPEQKRKLGRNELCHCGSGKKYKKCCLGTDLEKYGNAIKVSY